MPTVNTLAGFLKHDKQKNINVVYSTTTTTTTIIRKDDTEAPEGPGEHKRDTAMYTWT
jgi:hypothetical protein